MVEGAVDLMGDGNASEQHFAATKPEDALRSFLLNAQPVQYRAGAFHPGVEALDALVAEIERLRDRAVCSGCGSDVDEGGACNYPGCDDGEMIPASELPLALREMRDRRDEWRQEAMSL